MARIAFTWKSFILRFLFALLLVLATYNPHDLSYFHWVHRYYKVGEFTTEKTILIALAGLVLVIGWIIFLQAAWRSLGRVGILLAAAFFGLLVWLFNTWGLVDLTSGTALAYLSIFVLAAVLAIGMSWSFIHRRLTGQVDVDVVDDEH